MLMFCLVIQQMHNKFTFREKALTFTVNHQDLLAITHYGSNKNKTGVLIVVGGPQYRVGSHRQFVQLSRFLANHGISSMRFDYTGMGDSDGIKKKFDNICNDIKAAIDTFLEAQSHLVNVVVWGLCDAASAALIYAHKDSRVSGLVLLNPWLRNEKAMGKIMFKYYYLQRLLSRDFWKKLFSRKINTIASIHDIKKFAKHSSRTREVDINSYQYLMRAGLQLFQGKICLILSQNDFTALEFEQERKSNKAWKAFKKNGNRTHYLPEADHTFSSKHFKSEVEKISYEFVQNVLLKE